jgi:hypothetical protein
MHARMDIRRASHCPLAFQLGKCLIGDRHPFQTSEYPSSAASGAARLLFPAPSRPETYAILLTSLAWHKQAPAHGDKGNRGEDALA